MNHGERQSVYRRGSVSHPVILVPIQGKRVTVRAAFIVNSGTLHVPLKAPSVLRASLLRRLDCRQ